MGRREEGAGPLASRPRRRAAGPGEEERPPRGRDAERRRRAPVSEARHADAPAPAAAAEGEGGRRGAPRLADAVRLHLNAGRVHFPGGRAELKALLVERGAPPASLGRIDLHSSYSFLEVEASEVERLVQQLGGMELACGLVLQLEQARERGAR